MAQRLALPVNQMRITVGYKHPWYPKNPSTKGLTHYGVDCTYINTSKTTLYGLGVGEVTHIGMDTLLGGCVVVKYLNCECTDGKIRNLAVRYYHMDSISVKKGQKVTLDTKLGHMGNKGKYSSGRHLHFEIDTDINYPQYTPTLKVSSNIAKAGTDSTINPTLALWIKRSHPENQQVMSPYTPDKDRNPSVDYKDLEYKIM